MHLTVKGIIEPRHKMVLPGESGVICVLREDADDFSLEIAECGKEYGQFRIYVLSHQAVQGCSPIFRPPEQSLFGFS